MLYCYVYSVIFYIVIITNMKAVPQADTHKSPYISTIPTSNQVYTSLPSHGRSRNQPARVSATPPINTIDPQRLKKEITYLEKTMMQDLLGDDDGLTQKQLTNLVLNYELKKMVQQYKLSLFRPIKQNRYRRCTDACVIIPFVLMHIVFLALAIRGWAGPNFKSLMTMFDSNGKGCGIPYKLQPDGQDYANYPYLYFLDPQDQSMSSTVCVKQCPKHGQPVECMINSNSTATKKCPQYKYESRLWMYKFCMPTQRTLLENISQQQKIRIEGSSMFSQIINVRTAMYLIIFCILFSLLLTILIMILIRKTSKWAIFFLMTFAVTSFFSLGLYLLVRPPVFFLIGEEHSQLLFKILGVFLISLSFIIFYGFCKNRSKVKLTYAIAAVTAKFISKNKLIAFVPVISLTIIAFYLLYSFWQAMSFYSLGQMYPWMEEQPPFMFFKRSWKVNALLIMHLIQTLWTVAFIADSNGFIISGTVVNWYYNKWMQKKIWQQDKQFERLQKTAEVSQNPDENQVFVDNDEINFFSQSPNQQGKRAKKDHGQFYLFLQKEHEVQEKFQNWKLRYDQEFDRWKDKIDREYRIKYGDRLEEKQEKLKQEIFRPSLWRYSRYHIGSVLLGSFMRITIGILKNLYGLISPDSSSQYSFNVAEDIQQVVDVACCCCVKYLFKTMDSGTYAYIHLFGEPYCLSSVLLLGLKLRESFFNSLITFTRFILSMTVTMTSTAFTVLLAYLIIKINPWRTLQQIKSPAFLLIVIGVLAFIFSSAFSSLYMDTMEAVYVCYLIDITADQKQPSKITSKIIDPNQNNKNKQENQQNYPYDKPYLIQQYIDSQLSGQREGDDALKQKALKINQSKDLDAVKRMINNPDNLLSEIKVYLNNTGTNRLIQFSSNEQKQTSK